MWKPKNNFWFVLIIFIFLDCNNNSPEPISVKGIDAIDFASGDVVCRLGNGFFSDHFKDFSTTEKKYSHVGIIEVSGDSVFVYHAEASELTGVGFVKKENINSFLHEIKKYALYRIDCADSIKNNIVKEAKVYYLKKTSFDLDFDLNKEDEVYCTELVAKSINKAFNDTIIYPEIKINKRLFYGVDNIYLNPKFHRVYEKE